MEKLKQFFSRNQQAKTAYLRPEKESAVTISSTEDGFPDGIKVWHNPKDATVDICFVHGLSGNRDKSWGGEGLPGPWPAAFLPSRIPKARLLTYGYDAYMVRRTVASSNRLIDHANNLLHDLAAERSSADAATRPLIFVAHSFGGIVCKVAMIKSRNNPEPHLRNIFDCTKGIAFMGTPHRGSWLADWARIPARALGIIKSTNHNLLDVLPTNNEYLGSIQDHFLSMLRQVRESHGDLQITCFFEELPMPGYDRIVNKDSATFEGYNIVSIHANHSDMVKFGSVENNGFKRLLGELVRWEQSPRALDTEPAESGETGVTPVATPRLPASETPRSATVGSTENQATEERKPTPSSFRQSGSGHYFNTSGGTQNNNVGDGQQFFGGSFHGPVSFGSHK
ncbi:hypothetical protein NW762_013723 [Fusarium torreyae]|uniref:NACHT-NTPase sigma domain-containing protein n=1 Tax=Fusarium torreyae TaxID=1237075 RepID=A0A9W8RJY7_9HYPO|nr:hypothetical protein NW762_013723 [Fusarium torreyae]